MTKKITGWKRCRVVGKDGLVIYKDGLEKIAFVKLQILGKIIVPSEYSEQPHLVKKRTDMAKVLEVRGLKRGETAVSIYCRKNFGQNFEYKKGRVVTPMLPLDERTVQCASGIHYFSTLKEAKEYDYR